MNEQIDRRKDYLITQIFFVHYWSFEIYILNKNLKHAPPYLYSLFCLFLQTCSNQEVITIYNALLPENWGFIQLSDYLYRILHGAV